MSVRVAGCPAATALGGIARRATLVAQLREQNVESLLLLDAGNSLFGPDSVASNGRVIAEAYAALRYDVINISYRDFRAGLEQTRNLVDDAKLPGVSANLIGEDGKPISAPYLVKQVGSARVAVVGVTERPDGLEHLPHLQEQLRGVEIADPLKMLAGVVPEARSKSDYVVVLLYGSGATARAVRERFAGQLDALLVGGLRPAELVAAVAENPSRPRPPARSTDSTSVAALRQNWFRSRRDCVKTRSCCRSLPASAPYVLNRHPEAPRNAANSPNRATTHSWKGLAS